MRFSQFLISGKPVEYVQRWPHLGNIIGEEFTYSECVEKRRDVLGQVIDVLSIFRKLDPTVKIELLYRYCSSFYGSVLWYLQPSDISLICSAWRFAIRQIWRLAYNTYSDIVSALTSSVPLYGELCFTVVDFHFSLGSQNSVISKVCQFALFEGRASSPHGRNMMFLSNRYSCAWQYYLNESARQAVIEHAHNFCNNWFSRVADARFNLLAEMLLLRNESLFIEQSDTSFSSDDIEFIIDDLCTS